MAECEAMTASHEDDQLAFFETLSLGFARAGSLTGVLEQDYRIAGCKLRLCFAGPALIPAIVPALAHLECPVSGKPDLTIEIFDSKSTGAPLPFPAARFVDLLRLRWWEYLDNRREIKGLNGERIRSVFHLGPDILSLLDTHRDRAVYWVEDGAMIPYYEKGYPLSFLLNWWLARRGRYFVHAAAIGLQEGGILLTGKGGSGKSTTTLACVESELGICGDDYTAIEPARAVAHSLYNTVKLKSLRDVERFPALKGCVSNLDRVGEGENGEKAMIFLHEHHPHKLLEQMPVRAILVPRIADSPETRIVPASAALAFKALAPSTLFQLPGNAHKAFRALVEMVRRIPAYEIALGSDIPRIPAIIRQFIQSI
ncbi:MAG: serine kinase [Candidatus Competibacteraceae bacterium]